MLPVWIHETLLNLVENMLKNELTLLAYSNSKIR